MRILTVRFRFLRGGAAVTWARARPQVRPRIPPLPWSIRQLVPVSSSKPSQSGPAVHSSRLDLLVSRHPAQSESINARRTTSFHRRLSRHRYWRVPIRQLSAEQIAFDVQWGPSAVWRGMRRCRRCRVGCKMTQIESNPPVPGKVSSPSFRYLERHHIPRVVGWVMEAGAGRCRKLFGYLVDMSRLR